VVSFTIRNVSRTLELRNLSQPISIQIPTQSQESLIQQALLQGIKITSFNGTAQFRHPYFAEWGHVSVSCRFFNTTTGAWSSDGCTVAHTNDNFTVCTCNHLTSFSVFFPPNNFELFGAAELIGRLSDRNFVTLLVILLWFSLFAVSLGFSLRGSCPSCWAGLARWLGGISFLRIDPAQQNSRVPLVAISHSLWRPDNP
jgi:hypothetical protein